MKVNTIKEEIMSNIESQIDSQDAKGFKKYNQTLDDCDYDNYDWLEMANQELIDLAQYQQKEIRRLRKRIKELEGMT